MPFYNSKKRKIPSSFFVLSIVLQEISIFSIKFLLLGQLSFLAIKTYFIAFLQKHSIRRKFYNTASKILLNQKTADCFTYGVHHTLRGGGAVAQLVGELCYKPEGRGFDS
jgi:hypothetical protein